MLGTSQRAVGGGGERSELSAGDETQPLYGFPEPEPAGLGTQFVAVRAVAGDHQPQSRVPAAQPGEGGENVLQTFFVHQSAAEQQEWGVQCGPVRAADRTNSGGGDFPVLRVNTVRDGVHFGRWQLEELGDLPAHVFAAGQHPAGLVREPPFDRMNGAVQVAGQPALVPAGLGGVHGGDQRHPEVVFEGGGGVRDEPVVGVDDLGLDLVADRERRPGDGVVEGPSSRPAASRG